MPTKRVVPSLGGQQLRHRPVVAVMVGNGVNWQLRDGLLDTGSDETVFSDSMAAGLGLDLSKADQRSISLVGRPQPIICRYADVRLRISDGIEIYEWSTTVGFMAARVHYALLGQARFIQFFSADFDGEARVATLTPRLSLPGRRN